MNAQKEQLNDDILGKINKCESLKNEAELEKSKIIKFYEIKFHESSQ